MTKRLLAALALFTLALLALGTTVGSAQTVTIGNTFPSESCSSAVIVQTANSAYVVPAGNWRVTSSNWSRRVWRPTLKAAGVEDLHFHDLRHFAASALRDAGMDNKMRSVVIGHTDERVTDGVYTHISEEQVAMAAGRFDPLKNVATGLNC